MNKTLKHLGLSLLSALLLTLSWEPIGFFPLIFVGFVPLFLLEESLRNSNRSNLKLFLYGWLTFLVWNIGTVWWIKNASLEGGLAAYVINSLPMVLPLMMFHRSRLRNGKPDYGVFIIFWLAVELMQFHWDLAFPWLILGNVFSQATEWVQWYEYTGVLGGSLWILALNIAVFLLISKWQEFLLSKNLSKLAWILMLGVAVPGVLSAFIYNKRSSEQLFRKGEHVEVVLVQPNIDPYKDKFGGMTPEAQLEKMLTLADSKVTDQTKLLVMPETSLQGGLEENHLENESVIIQLHEWLERHPQVTVVSGADTYKTFPNRAPGLPITARYLKDYDITIDAYNTAIWMNVNGDVQIYHKNKMVPGVEKMPYPEVFGFLEKYAINLGGTSGSLGSDGESKVFQNKAGLRIAPVICYESIFPDFCASYVVKGARLICIVTNDGWWGNTPGYQQHFSYARLRAIETRRYVVRAANTGASGVIDEMGNVLQRTDYWKEAAVIARVPLLNEQTFYVSVYPILNGILLLLVIFEVIRIYWPKRR